MKKAYASSFIALLIPITALILLVCQSHAQEGPAFPAPWTDIPGGKYVIEQGVMIIVMDEPVMTDRLSKYGYIDFKYTAKGVPIANSHFINLDHENKTTPKMADLRIRILNLRKPNNKFFFRLVVLQEHDQILITRKDQKDLWPDLITNQLMPIFEDAFGEKGLDAREKANESDLRAIILNKKE